MTTTQDWLNTHPQATIYAERLWDDPRVPKRGWVCVNVVDLGATDDDYDPGICQMCRNEQLRYVHTMQHASYGQVETGCICAEHMSEGYDGQARERALKNVAARRGRWLARRWRTSRKGNLYLSLNGYTFGLFDNRGWKWWIKAAGETTYSSRAFPDMTRAQLNLFDYLIANSML